MSQNLTGSSLRHKADTCSYARKGTLFTSSDHFHVDIILQYKVVQR